MNARDKIYPPIKTETLFYCPLDLSFSNQMSQNDPVAFQLQVQLHPQEPPRQHVFLLKGFSAGILLQREPLLRAHLECSVKELTTYILDGILQQRRACLPQAAGLFLEEFGFHPLSNGDWCTLLGRELVGSPLPFACAHALPAVELLPSPTLTQTECIDILLQCPEEVLLGLAFLMLTSIRSLLSRWDIPFQGVLFLTGRQGIGKTTLAKRLFLIYRSSDSGTPAGIIQASSTNASQISLLNQFRDMPLVVDDLCLSSSKTEERKRRETGAQLVRIGSGDMPITKRVGNQTVSRFCQAGVILTAEYDFSAASDITRCLILPLKEQLSLPKGLSPAFSAHLLRQFAAWTVTHMEVLKQVITGFLEESNGTLAPRMRTNYACLRGVFACLLMSLNTPSHDVAVLTKRLKKQVNRSTDHQEELLNALHSTVKRCNLSAILLVGMKDYFSLAKNLDHLDKHDGILWHGDLCLRKAPLLSFVRRQPGYQNYTIRRIVQELSDIDALVVQGDEYTVSLGKKGNKKKAPRVYRLRISVLKETAELFEV